MNVEVEKFCLPDETAKLCRICLLNDQSGQNIFSDKSSLSLLQKLIFYGGIEILENDGLPNKICFQCISKIDSVHKFRMQCQSADKRLREILGLTEKVYRMFSTVERREKGCQTNLNDLSTILVENRKLNEIQKEENNVFNDTENVDIEQCNSIPDSIYCSNDQAFMKENKIKNESLPSKEFLKVKRASVFKRVTSIENMKNHRERQRQYLKKSSTTKSEVSIKRRKSTNGSDCEDEATSVNRSHYVQSTDMNGAQVEQFRCSYCDKQFPKYENLLSHEKVHESKAKTESARCQICDKVFRKVDTMVRHLNVHKKANPNEVLSILKEMRLKRKMADGVSDDKKRKSVFASGESDHLNFSNTNVVVKEEFFDSNVDCESKKDSDKAHSSCDDGLTRIVRQKPGNLKEALPDPLSIDKPNDDKVALKLINKWIREELDSDNESKDFSCEHCGKTYVSRRSLTKHRTTVHEEPPTDKDQKACECTDKPKSKTEKAKPYSCKQCDKSFEKETRLEKHQKIHEKAKEQLDSSFKRFLCHICSKTFRQNTGLMFHMRTHTGYKPHVCKYCGRGFTSNSNCINHERTHTGDRPFICHFCSAAFAKSCTLKAHITTHTGEANYHCKTCGKSFRRLKYLKEHRFTHTGEKPYACKLCGTAYSHSGSLFVHEKKCKANYNSNGGFQATIGQGAVGLYYQQSHTAGDPAVAPVIMGLSLGSQMGGHSSSVIQESKAFVQRAASQVGFDGSSRLHLGADSQNASGARDFSISGHIFQA